jgi:hypothetical protein
MTIISGDTIKETGYHEEVGVTIPSNCFVTAFLAKTETQREGLF